MNSQDIEGSLRVTEVASNGEDIDVSPIQQTEAANEPSAHVMQVSDDVQEESKHEESKEARPSRNAQNSDASIDGQSPQPVRSASIGLAQESRLQIVGTALRLPTQEQSQRPQALTGRGPMQPASRQRSSERTQANMTEFQQLSFQAPHYERQSDRGQHMANLDTEPIMDTAAELTFYGSYDHAGHQVDEYADDSNERSDATFQIQPVPADTSNPYIWHLRRNSREAAAQDNANSFETRAREALRGQMGHGIRMPDDDESTGLGSYPLRMPLTRQLHRQQRENDIQEQEARQIQREQLEAIDQLPLPQNQSAPANGVNFMPEMRLIGRQAIQDIEDEAAQERSVLQREIQQLREQQEQLRRERYEQEILLSQQDRRTLEAAQAYIGELEAENAYFRRMRYAERSRRFDAAMSATEEEEQRDRANRRNDEPERSTSPQRLMASMNEMRFRTEQVQPQAERSVNHVSSFSNNQRSLRSVPQSRIHQRAPEVSRESDERPASRDDDEASSESMMDYVHMIPKEFAEELLDKRFDNTLSIAILLNSGPLTLLMFNRSLDLSHRYSEFRDIRLYPMSESTRNQLALHLSRKLATFAFFTMQMAQKDLMHQWRTQKLFMHVLPTAAELKAALKQALKLDNDRLLIDRELIMWKTVFEIMEAFEQRRRGDKELQRYIYPCLERIIKRGGDKLVSETRRMLGGCLALNNSKLIIEGQSATECLQRVSERSMNLRAVTSSTVHRVSSCKSRMHAISKDNSYDKNTSSGKAAELPLDLSCGSPVRIQRPPALQLRQNKIKSQQKKRPQKKTNKASAHHGKHKLTPVDGPSSSHQPRNGSDLCSQFL